MLFGAPGTNNGAPSDNNVMVNVMYGLVVFNSITSAVGNISMREMKKFRGVVIAWYGSWAMMLLSLLFVVGSGQGVSIFYNFSAFSWFLLLVNGITAALE